MGGGVGGLLCCHGGDALVEMFKNNHKKLPFMGVAPAYFDP